MALNKFVNNGSDDGLISSLPTEGIPEYFIKSMNRAGLVQKQVTVHGKNGDYQAMKWVRASDDKSNVGVVKKQPTDTSSDNYQRVIDELTSEIKKNPNGNGLVTIKLYSDWRMTTSNLANSKPSAPEFKLNIDKDLESKLKKYAKENDYELNIYTDSKTESISRVRGSGSKQTTKTRWATFTHIPTNKKWQERILSNMSNNKPSDNSDKKDIKNSSGKFVGTVETVRDKSGRTMVIATEPDGTKKEFVNSANAKYRAEMYLLNESRKISQTNTASEAGKSESNTSNNKSSDNKSEPKQVKGGPVDISKFSFKNYLNPDGQNRDGYKTYRESLQSVANETEQEFNNALNRYNGKQSPYDTLSIAFNNINTHSSYRDMVGKNAEQGLKDAENAILSRQKELLESAKEYTKWDDSQKKWVKDSEASNVQTSGNGTQKPPAKGYVMEIRTGASYMYVYSEKPTKASAIEAYEKAGGEPIKGKVTEVIKRSNQVKIDSNSVKDLCVNITKDGEYGLPSAVQTSGTSQSTTKEKSSKSQNSQIFSPEYDFKLKNFKYKGTNVRKYKGDGSEDFECEIEGKKIVGVSTNASNVKVGDTIIITNGMHNEAIGIVQSIEKTTLNRNSIHERAGVEFSCICKKSDGTEFSYTTNSENNKKIRIIFSEQSDTVSSQTSGNAGQKLTPADAKKKTQSFTSKVGKSDAERNAFMDKVKASGITWNRSDNIGIDWMRCCMAMNKHFANGGTFDNSANRATITSH